MPTPKPLAAAVLGLAAAACHAEIDATLKAAVQAALETQPEVTARVNALKAGDDAVEVARSGLRPRVALEGRLARTNDTITTRNPEGQRLNQTGVALTLNQLIWDGMGTFRDVTRTQRERTARWYELADATEQTALEAARAHYDVLRYRELVALAEENYVQHRTLYGQLSAKAGAGVGRGVDMEQANARLALADSNLINETSNLHDVSARYQRVVGALPGTSMRFATLEGTALPASSMDAVTVALRDNAQVSAAIEALRAARENAAAREGAYHPRVEARVRSGTGRNFDGVPDQKRDTTAEILLNWSLWDGGASVARVREAANLLNQAADQRDRVCREVRQTAEIAYNDTLKLADLQKVLDRNTIAIEKARDAYRQQFDIGQRSLLDLLNAENELYTARRALANSRYDFAIAQARALASTQRLVRELGLEVALPKPAEDDPRTADDLPSRCPSEVVQLQTTDRRALDERAERLMQAAPKR